MYEFCEHCGLEYEDYQDNRLCAECEENEDKALFSAWLRKNRRDGETPEETVARLYPRAQPQR